MFGSMFDSVGNELKLECKLRSSLHRDGIIIYCVELKGSLAGFTTGGRGASTWYLTQEQLDQSNWVVCDYATGG